MVTAERTTAHPASGRTTADAYAARFGHGGECHARHAASGAAEELATPLTGDAARAHLRGEASIGLYLGVYAQTPEISVRPFRLNFLEKNR